MSELKTLSNGQVVTLLDGDELGDAGDVLMRVGADGAAYRPVSDVAAAWGGITGTLSAQTDLQSALDAKAAASSVFLRQATVELTDAQIKALPTTGVQIVAAPGANKVLILDRGFYKLAWTADYTNISATDAYLNILVGTIRASLLAPTNFFLNAGGGDVISFITPANTLDTSASDDLSVELSGYGLSQVTNKAFTVKASNSGNYTGGNAANTLRISVTYYILNTLTGVFE